MNRFLDEVKVLMHENGYSIEDIKKVVDSFNHFFEYISRNKLEKEFMEAIGYFRTNVLRRIGRKPVSNIASVAEFNGTSPASTFIKSCVEKKVQDILNGFLRSSEVYYNMACNSEGIDVTRILAQLSLDNLDRDTSVELTAPNTIISFSTELSLKTLYSIKNYDAIVRNIYSEVTRYENGSYPNEELLNNRLGLIEIVSGDWKNIGISSSAQNTMNNVRDTYSIQDRPVNLPEDDKFGNVKVNGHTLYKVFDNLPEEIRSMIKYQIVTACSRSDKKSLNDRVVSAIDYFLMSTEIDTTLNSMDPTKQMVINSNNFDRMRYLIDQLGSEELLFSMSFATSSYIVARSEVDGRSFSTIKNCDYSSKGIQYTETLDNLISSSDKKYLLDYIVNNRQLLGVVKTLSPKDLYVLIDMFNLDELNWMKDSCNVEDSCSFREMLHYCVFFKRHLNDYEFRYTGDKYKNINKLFYTIKSTNNLAMLGSQISQWFAEINVYGLSQEEFDALRIFDNEFIFNSLSYRDRVLYKKCSDNGVPFKIYYTSSAYSFEISRYMRGNSFDRDDFESHIEKVLNRNFNRVLVVNDKNLNKLEENSELMELLCEEFGDFKSIPNSIRGLPLNDLKIIIDYCHEKNISIKDWARQLLGESCFFCRASYIMRNIGNKYEKYMVRIPLEDEDENKLNSYFHIDNERPDIVSGTLLMRYKNVFNNGVSPFKFHEYNRVALENGDIKISSRLLNHKYYELDVDIEKITSKEVLSSLLDRGFDYMTATFLGKNCTEEELKTFLDFFDRRGIPQELLPAVISNRITIRELIDRAEFFLNQGCRLDEIPLNYYIRTGITIDVFTKLFQILDGVYKKEHIHNSLLVSDTDGVENLINKLKDSNINIYHFMSYMSGDSTLLLSRVDEYIYAYNIVKDIPVNSNLEIKTFDIVVSEYDVVKKKLGLEQDDPLLFKGMLYQDYDGAMYIREECAKMNKAFLPELLYFDPEYIEENFETAYMCVFSYRMSNRELEHQDALNIMINSGWMREYKEKNDKKPRKVA